MKELFTQIIGTADTTSFLASCFFAGIGVLLSLLLHSNSRNVLDPKSPVQFSWSYLLADNVRRLFIGVICVFIALRFSDQLLGAKLTLFFAFVIGASIDNLAMIIQNKVLTLIPKPDGK